jgi:hypothetical protein
MDKKLEELEEKLKGEMIKEKRGSKSDRGESPASIFFSLCSSFFFSLRICGKGIGLVER